MSAPSRLPPPADPIDALVDAIAARLVRNYLTSQAASNQVSEADRSNHVPLPPVDEAA
jgi:hypothetical protein